MISMIPREWVVYLLIGSRDNMVSWLFFYLCLSLLQVSCSQPCETKTLRQNRLGPPGPTNINDFFASFADDVGEAGPECLNITVEEGDYIVTEG